MFSPLVIKYEAEYLNLLGDICQTAKETTKRIKKDIRWLQFAKWLPDGNYLIMTGKTRQMDILSEITNEIISRHSRLTSGRVADIISYLVNTSVAEEMATRSCKIPKNPNLAEKEYLNRLLIETISSTTIPDHSWFYPSPIVANSSWGLISWKAKNLADGNIVIIHRFFRRRYAYFQINTLEN